MTIPAENKKRGTEIECLPKMDQILSSKMIRSDCDFLLQIQEEFTNTKIILCDDSEPYVHLYKNEDEAFNICFDIHEDILSTSDGDTIKTLNVDEKVAILISSIQNYLEEKYYNKNKKYILFYGGTYLFTETITEPKYNVFNRQYPYDRNKMLTYLKLLEIK